MWSKFIVLFVLIWICVNNVVSTKPSKTNDVKSINAVYKYNHPPGAEEYQSIPVAVIYENYDERVGKSVRSDARITNIVPVPDSQKITTYRPPTSYTTDATELFTDITESTNNVPATEELTELTPQKTTTAPSTNEYNIPVAIVYDETPQVNNTEVTKKLRKRLKQRRRKPQGYKTSDSNASVSTKKTDYKPSSDIKPTKISTNENDNKGNAEAVVVNKQVMYGAIRSREPLISDHEKSTQNLKKININPSTRQFKKRVNGDQDPVVPIIMSENYVYAHSGNFNYRYESGDGTTAFETGVLKSFGEDKTGESVVGSFSYKGKDGKDISISYTADENGYRPVGDHLPTPPPIPPAIARALAHLATKTTPEPVTETNRKNV